MFVDRFLHTAMYYPCNYGFIPHTLSDDGDAVDAVVMGQISVMSGCVIRSWPVGVLMMEDESGVDEKILCVPVDKLHPFYGNIGSCRDLRKVQLHQIQHFFTHYKDLEKGKWAKVQGWGEAQITNAYNLKATYVIHTLGPIWQGGEDNEDGLLAQCYRRSLDLVLGNNLKSVAFPAISTGVYHFLAERAAQIAITTTAAFLSGEDRIDQLIFCCFGEASRKAHEEALAGLKA